MKALRLYAVRLF